MSVRWKLHPAAFVALRNSPPVVANIQHRAERIAFAAGSGFETRPPETGSGRRGRARVAVIAASPEARREQADTSALTRAIDAGR